MSMSSPIQREILEIVVIGCNNLKDCKKIVPQFPYISLSYAGVQLRTGWFTNGGRNPRFNKKMKINIVEGFRVIAVTAWCKNMVASDSFVGDGLVDIGNALRDGFDDVTCNLLGTTGKHVGEVKLVLNYSHPEKYRKATIWGSRGGRMEEISSPRDDHRPSPSIPVTGYPPPSPPPPLYQPHLFYPTSPLYYSATTSSADAPPSPSAPLGPPPSAPTIPPPSPSYPHYTPSYDSPSFQMPNYHPSVSLEGCEPMKPK